MHRGLTGNKWKSVRTKLTPAFTSGKIKSSLPLIEECVDVFIKRIAASNGSIDVNKFNTELIMDIIVSYGFGLEREDSKPIREVGKIAIQTDFWIFLKRQIRLTFPWLFVKLRLKAFDPKVTEFFVGFVSEMFKLRKKMEITRPDLIQLLMEMVGYKTNDGIEFDDGLLAAQAFSFFVAGFETSTFTQSVMLYELALHPDEAQKARAEIYAVIEKHGKFNYEALQDMKYLHQVLQETMRKHPADYATPRICTLDYKIPNTEITIKAGTQIVVPMMAIQNDPTIFPSPELFQPKRFSSENKSKIINGSYLPFGDGPRKCIAMRFAQLQVKYSVARILYEFELELDPNTPVPLVMDEHARTSRYKGNILIKFNTLHNN